MAAPGRTRREPTPPTAASVLAPSAEVHAKGALAAALAPAPPNALVDAAVVSTSTGAQRRTPARRAAQRIHTIASPERSIAAHEVASAPLDVAPHVTPQTEEDTLPQELAVLHAAQAALDRGVPTKALELLDGQNQRYPQGVLRQERLATRVFACALGRVEEALTTARELVRMAPRVPYLARLRASCVAQVVR